MITLFSSMVDSVRFIKNKGLSNMTSLYKKFFKKTQRNKSKLGKMRCIECISLQKKIILGSGSQYPKLIGQIYSKNYSKNIDIFED